MNIVILMGRLTRDPDIRYGNDNMAIARYTLAVDRPKKKDSEERNADFVSCVAFSHNAEFAEKYFKKGTKIVINGRITTGSYTNKDGQKVYTTDVIVDHQEFAESKGSGDRAAADEAIMQAEYGSSAPVAAGADEFMQIPDGIDEELPFG
ncbi:MAG: single-stranded DNA-binding protein [Prevotellaceae bacterium]|nr:single-stranded DNA-binding protein [Candidatus Faecinaster equi]